MSFQKEFEQRLRRVIGLEDDSVDVIYKLDESEPGWSGCDTCGYGGDEARSWVEVWAYDSKTKQGYSKEFGDLGEMMRAMDAVEL